MSNSRQFDASPVPEPIDAGIIYIQTRGLLEHCVRARVESLPGITTRYRSRVVGLHVVAGRVAGVDLEAGAGHETISGELVVDATGAGSRTPKWIADLGYERPEESVVNCDFAYTSVFLK